MITQSSVRDAIKIYPLLANRIGLCNDMVVILQRRMKWMETAPITITGIGMISNN
jgi:hypothetical protein